MSQRRLIMILSIILVLFCSVFFYKRVSDNKRLELYSFLKNGTDINITSILVDSDRKKIISDSETIDDFKTAVKSSKVNQREFQGDAYYLSIYVDGVPVDVVVYVYRETGFTISIAMESFDDSEYFDYWKNVAFLTDLEKNAK